MTPEIEYRELAFNRADHPERQYRFISGDFELRAAEGAIVAEGDVSPPPTNVLAGYAARFNVLSATLSGGQRERIMPGAFAESLSNGPEVQALLYHDTNFPLGNNRSAGNLKIQEDHWGLPFTLEVAPTSYGKDLLINSERKILRGMSFGFEPLKVRRIHEDGGPVDEVLQARLWEISVVLWPAYQQSFVGMKREEAVVETIPCHDLALLALFQRQLELSN